MRYPAAPRRLFACAVAVFLASAGAAAAQQPAEASCVKPPMPICIDDLTTFVSADRMVDCQNKVKVYMDYTMNYLYCRQGNDAATNAEFISAVNRFNCRLGGGQDCR